MRCRFWARASGGSGPLRAGRLPSGSASPAVPSPRAAVSRGMPAGAKKCPLEPWAGNMRRAASSLCIIAGGRSSVVEAALPLLNVQGVARIFGGGRTWLGQTRPGVHALRGVTFDVRQGETLGIVGESGCGKSTLARILVGLDRPSAGEVHFQGSD